MSYCSQNDIEAEVGGQQNLIPFLDDTNTGELNSALLVNIFDRVQAKIDGRLAGIYSVPISPVVPLIRDAAVIFTCELLYKRRLAPMEKNPYAEQAKDMLAWLDKIASGEASLDASVARAFTPGFTHSRAIIYSSPFGGNNLSNSM